jgi:hypothetical protein
MRSLGAPDPEGWARSEQRENIAQQARFLFLRGIWPDMIDPYRDPDVLRKYPAFARLLEAGADPDDLARGARAVAYETVFSMLYHVDFGADEDAPPDTPGWRLVETDADRQPTGRDVGMLHEDLQSLDPSGNEAADLFK